MPDWLGAALRGILMMLGTFIVMCSVGFAASSLGAALRGILMMLGTFIVMCSVGFAASSDVIRVNEVEISEIDFDGIWPFTVSSGLLRCTLTNHVYATHRVTFLVDGVEYAVNGTAGLGGRHPDIGPIWMIDPTHPVPGIQVRVSLASVLLFGLSLCDD